MQNYADPYFVQNFHLSRQQNHFRQLQHNEVQLNRMFHGLVENPVNDLSSQNKELNTQKWFDNLQVNDSSDDLRAGNYEDPNKWLPHNTTQQLISKTGAWVTFNNV